MRATRSRFDRIAQSYESSLSPLPERYCRLIQRRFALGTDDRVVDLGCGSGLLTFPLARFSDRVEGLDISKELIRIAKRKDTERKIKWIVAPVEKFNFGHDRYKLIIAYESFHLFPNIDRLIRRFERGLLVGGYLCIGSCYYSWEEQLEDVFIDTFQRFGVDWGEPKYQTCPWFPDILRQNSKHLSPAMEEVIQVPARRHIRSIAACLSSIDKAASLTGCARHDLINELTARFRVRLSSDWTEGLSSYFIHYTKRLA